jgi:hypothetical protein
MKYLVQIFGTMSNGDKISNDITLSQDEFEKFKTLYNAFIKIYNKFNINYDDVWYFYKGLGNVLWEYDIAKAQNREIHEYYDKDLRILLVFNIDTIKMAHEFIYSYMPYSFRRFTIESEPRYPVEFNGVKYLEIDNRNFLSL